MDRVVEVVIALVYLFCLFLWFRQPSRRRDEVDELAERRRDRVRPETRDV